LPPDFFQSLLKLPLNFDYAECDVNWLVVVSLLVENDGDDNGLNHGCQTSPGADSYLSTGSSAELSHFDSRCRIPCRLQLVKPLEGDLRMFYV